MVGVVPTYVVVRINKRAKEHTRAKGAKEVEPDGHGEVARGHVLKPTRVSFQRYTKVVPLIPTPLE
jgi:hypothetical protein